jgi:Family of unknown function (DUF6544)
MNPSAEALLERVRRFAMPEGDVEARDVRFSQQGEMRLAPDAPWRPFRAEQWKSGSSIDFRWRAWFRMVPFAPVLVADSFERGAGALTAAAFGLIPVARGRGPDFDRGEVMRALAELPWRPFAFGRLAKVAWEAAGEGGLRATFDDGRTRASVDLDIDGEGRVLGGSAIRPRAVGKSTVETKWSGSFGDYRGFGRIRVPASAEVAWLSPEGRFDYWRGRIIAFASV